MFEKSGTPAATLATIAIVQFLVSLDLSVVNVGLPRIRDALGFDVTSLPWVIHAYVLAFGGLLLLGGRAADRYGRRRVLLVGLCLFAAASLVGGLAESPTQLVAARACQGVGAAALAPAALAILSTTFPEGRARARAFGVWSAMNAGGGAFGVLIGGLLVEHLGWRWVMFVSVPMAVVAFVLGIRGVAAGGGTARAGRPDAVGGILATAGMSALVFGVTRAQEDGWTGRDTLLALGFAAVALGAFVWHERRTTADPLIPPGLIARRSVAGANTFNLLVGGAMASAFFFLSIHLQQLGHDPARTGIEFLPLALAVVLGSIAAVRLSRRVAPRALMIAGSLISAAGFALLGFITPDGAFAMQVLPPSIVLGAGFGLCLGPVVSVATAGVAAHESGAASALLNSSRQIGASLGLAALGTVAAARTGGRTTTVAATAGHAAAFTGGAVLLLLAAAIALAVLSGRSRGDIGADSAELHKKGKINMTVTTSTSRRPALVASFAGLALTLVVAALPFAGGGALLAGHIAESYPSYGPGEVGAAVSAWQMLLGTVGALGGIGWLWTAWTIRTDRRWARWSAMVLLVIALAVALSGLLMLDTSGEVGLAPVLGWAGLVPCLAGVATVALLWRRSRATDLL